MLRTQPSLEHLLESESSSQNDCPIISTSTADLGTETTLMTRTKFDLLAFDRAGSIETSRPFHLKPPYLHLICGLHLICSFPSRISHLVNPIYPIRRHPPASGRHLESRAFRICHLFHFAHLIYPIPSHLDLGWPSCPSHLPTCLLKMEIEIWVFTSVPGRASPQDLPETISMNLGWRYDNALPS